MESLNSVHSKIAKEKKIFIKKRPPFGSLFFAANCKTYAENNVPSSKNIHSCVSQTFSIDSSSIE